jgi:hypothetical protein
MSQKKTGCGSSTCHPSYSGSISRRITVQAGPGKKPEPILKITPAKKAGGKAQVVELELPASQVQSSDFKPSTAKNKLK